VAYDEDLADRIRALLRPEAGIAEKAMFGGLGFLVHGNMAVAASGQGGILLRVAGDDADELVASTPAEPMEMRGRPLRGWVRVGPDDLAGAALDPWVARGLATARALPPKG
jgi:hypothetical protein